MRQIFLYRDRNYDNLRVKFAKRNRNFEKQKWKGCKILETECRITSTIIFELDDNIKFCILTMHEV